MTDQNPHDAAPERRMAKKDANRIAAARVYVAASKKAGIPVPPSVTRLASGRWQP